MPGGWDPSSGQYISTETQVRDRLLRIMDTGPNGTAANGKIDITGTGEQSLVVNGAMVYLQNVGDNRVYMDGKTGVNADKWEILPRMRVGPITAKDKLFFFGAGASTLKFLFVGGV